MTLLRGKRETCPPAFTFLTPECELLLTGPFRNIIFLPYRRLFSVSHASCLPYVSDAGLHKATSGVGWLTVPRARAGVGYQSVLTDAVSLVLGQLKTWPALAGNTALRSLLADVTTAVILIHAAQTLCKTAACSQ